MFFVEETCDGNDDGGPSSYQCVLFIEGGSCGIKRDFRKRKGNCDRCRPRGADPGMIGIGGLEEKGINLAVSMKLKEALENQGFTVVMTRQEDKGLYEEGTRNKKVQDMQNRIEIMEKAKPILAVSIHQNSYTEESVKGPQVFYYETSAEGQKLAVNIQSALNTELSTERPRKEKGNTSYFLLKKSPCVLNIVECGFLTNKKEAELLQTEEYQQKIVEAVVKGIVQYMEGK